MKILMVLTSHERNWDPLSIVDGRLVTGQNPAPKGLSHVTWSLQ